MSGPEWKRGRPGINLGRKYSQETIEKMRLKAIGRKCKRSKEVIDNKKKCIWWNNGKQNRHCKDCPGEGWSRGRGKYWNNGYINTLQVQCPGEEWVRGMIRKTRA